jgi:hypothetical protein
MTAGGIPSILVGQGCSLFNGNQDAEQREYLMTSRTVTTQKAAFVMPETFGFDIEKPENYSTADKSGDGITPQKFTGPTSTCEHDWLKLANDLQTLASEGKTIWICSTCAEITNTYSWQTL